MTCDCTAQRSHQIAECKYSKCGKELSDPILMREKFLADCRGKKAVDSEIVPFEHVADHARDDHPTHLGRIHIHVLPKRTRSSVAAISAVSITIPNEPVILLLQWRTCLTRPTAPGQDALQHRCRSRLQSESDWWRRARSHPQDLRTDRPDLPKARPRGVSP